MPRPTLTLVLFAACCAAFLLQGCSPALDWREARLGGQVQLVIPCKPDRIERQLELAGGQAQALMVVCDAEGVSWSATRYELGDPGRVDAALRELRYKLAQNIGGEERRVEARLPGPPAVQARRSQLSGKRPGGEAVRAEALFFGEASRVYQVVALWPIDARPALVEQAGQYLDGVHLGH
ncbi:MAG: hypothetical protein IPG93_10715 [Burkholderiales bacterium]|nr:hypothetical protein [Burkholderiales bacterium]